MWVKLGTLRGRDGLDGLSGRDGSSGVDGLDGVSIIDIEQRTKESFTIILSDKTEKTFQLPKVKGKMTTGGAGQETYLRSGDGVPSAGLGNLGDHYIDKVSKLFYGPKTGAGWGSGISLSSAPDYIQFDLTDTGPIAEGEMRWNNNKGLPEVQLAHNFDLEVGEQLIKRVINKTGSTLNKGKVVYINGGQGNRPTVALASNDSENTSSKTFAVLAGDIADNNNGWAIVSGALYNIDTSSYTAGQTLYLGTSGNMTGTKPTSPAHMVVIAQVVNVHATEGVLEVSIQNGYEIEELHNVQATSALTGQILIKDADGYWKTGIDADLHDNGLTADYLAVDKTYSGTSYFKGIAADIIVNTPTGADTFDYVANTLTITDTHATSGTIEDAAFSISGYQAAINRTADSSVDWLDGNETIYGYGLYMARGGSFTGQRHDVDMIGYNLVMNNEVGYNNASGSYTQNLFGSKMTIQSTGTVSAGSVTKNLYGQYYAFSCGGEIAATAIYANYLATMAGADVMYYLYALPNVPSYLRGDLGLGVEIPTAKLDIEGSTTSKASLRIRAGTAPTSPNDGDIWQDGTNIYARLAGSNQQLNNSNSGGASLGLINMVRLGAIL